MKTGGFGRALRYFIRQAQFNLLMTIAGSFAMGVYIWMINGSSSGLGEMIMSVPSAVLYISMLILFVSGTSEFQNYYLLPLIFGCLRKNVFLGNLAMDFLFIAECLAFYESLPFLFQMEPLAFGFSTIFSLYLVLEGIARLVGIATMKWGKVAYVLMAMGVAAISFAFGILLVYARKSGFFIETAFENTGMQMWKWMLLAACAAICVAANVASYRVISHFEVKA